MTQRTPALVTVMRQPFSCLACHRQLFVEEHIRLQLRPAVRAIGDNPPATALICAECGYVHPFMSNAIEFWDPGEGYPRSGPE